VLYLIKPGTKYDFIGKAAPFFAISVISFVIGVIVLAVMGLNLGLDFAGGHQILLRFEKPVSADDVRTKLNNLFPGIDTSVQSYEVPTEADKTFYLTRIERAETLSPEQVKGLEDAFRTTYGDKLTKFSYNPEAGDVVEAQFVAGATTSVDLSNEKLRSVVEGAGHPVGDVRQIGKLDPPVYRVVLKGVDTVVVKAMQELDPAASAPNVEFVGPTVGQQLRNEGMLAMMYALLCIMIYVALRFDFYYAPGAVICLFHDAILTVAILTLVGEEFTTATIAGVLTLIGYSINDTIVVFDRIRETAGKLKGVALRDMLNRAINETLNRTVGTGLTTLLACFGLLLFGGDTVLAQFGLMMLIGILLGTYSSIFVATPVFLWLKEKYGPSEVAMEGTTRRGKAAPAS
jgi:preprotein translocase subunit SecF